MLDSIEYKGHTIEVHRDDHNGDGPRDWDNIGTMVCFHRRYTLGDEQPTCKLNTYLKDLAVSLDSSLENKLWHWEDGPGWSQLMNANPDTAVAKSNRRQARAVEAVLDREIPIMLDLYLYDHSGLRMKVGSFHGHISQSHAQWDSGQVGFIYVTRETLRHEYSVKRVSKQAKAKAEKYLRGEVTTYDQYISGQVYGYILKDANGEHLDSCWGFYGGTDEMVAEVKGGIDWAEAKELERIAALAREINSVRTVIWP